MRPRSRALILAFALFGLIRAADTAHPRPASITSDGHAGAAGPGVSPALAARAAVPIVFDRVSVIDMASPAEPRTASVLVRDGRIAAIGDLADVDVPEGAIRIDGRGRFLMPGLVDAHVHLFDENDLPVLLAHGITTVLNMSGSPFHLEMRERIASGGLRGPTLYTTGPQLKTDVNPPVDFERLADSPETVERLIAYQAEAGYDFVKVWGPVSPRIYDAIMTSAAAHDIRVTGHIPRDVGLEATLAAGQSSIAHVEEYYNKVFGRRIDDGAVPAAARATAAAGTPVITTLVTYEAIAGGIAEDPTPLLDRPARAWLDPVRQRMWEPGLNRYRTASRIGRDAEYLEALAFEGRIAKALHDAGVPLIAGSDAGEIPGLVPGADLHRELELLAEAGLTPYEALAAATRNPGGWLAPDDPFGTIEVGRPADLVLLDANPLEDLANLENPSAVVTRGLLHTSMDIAAMLEEIRRINARTGRFAEILLSDGIDAAERYVSDAPDGRPAFAATPALFLAFSFAERGEMETAVRVLELVAAAYPDAYLPRYMLGVALLGAGEVARGRALLEEVLRLVPGHDGATMWLERTSVEGGTP